MAMIQLSVAIVARDEEERLPACLRSVGFADEVLVVDSGSRDRTVAVAREFGCRVLEEPWRGYARQKQFAVENCSHDWVLVLDADERIPPATAQGIRRTLEVSAHGVAAFSLLRKSYFHGRWVRTCGWWPDRVVRLVDRRLGHFDDRLVHESWVTQGQVVDSNLIMEHWSFKDYSGLIAKMESYSTLAAQDLWRRGARCSPLAPATHGIWMFFRSYVLEKGILDGLDGLVISLLNAGGSFLKYAKLAERLRHMPSEAQPGDPSLS